MNPVRGTETRYQYMRHDSELPLSGLQGLHLHPTSIPRISQPQQVAALRNAPSADTSEAEYPQGSMSAQERKNANAISGRSLPNRGHRHPSHPELAEASRLRDIPQDSSSRPEKSSTTPAVSSQMSNSHTWLLQPHLSMKGTPSLTNMLTPTHSFGDSSTETPSHSSSSASSFIQNSTSNTQHPILDHQAAHALTILRSSHDQAQIHTETCLTSTLCQEQACPKNDCPSNTQIICPAEEIEAQFCEGNCVGSLCTGVGCPYSTATITAYDPYGYHGYDTGDCSDFWSCQWACDLDTCNIAPPNNQISLQCVTGNEFGPQQHGNYAPYFPDPIERVEPVRTDYSNTNNENGMLCSIEAFADSIDLDEMVLNQHYQNCHNPLPSVECHWRHCPIDMTTGLSVGQRSDIPRLQQSTTEEPDSRPSPSINNSPSSPLTYPLSVDAKTNGYKCMWIVHQASGTLCSFTCHLGNDMQAHIESAHIDLLPSTGGSSQRTNALRRSPLIICQWKDCKHSIQKKVLRSSKALKQHVFTHSRCEYNSRPLCRPFFFNTGNIDRGAQCSECGELFVDKASLENHMRRHTGERPFKCRYCGDAFAFRAILSRSNTCSGSLKAEIGVTIVTHERTHTGDKVFKCSACGYETGDSSNFSRHKLIHKNPQYNCEVCGKSFCRREHMKRHMRNLHKDYIPRPDLPSLLSADLALADMTA